MNGPLELSPLQLAGAAALVLVNGVVSAWLGLGLGRRLLLASVRTVAQLSLLGWILVPVFRTREPLAIAAITTMMVALAGFEAVRRAGRRYRAIHLDAFLSLLVCAGATTVLATAVIVGVRPWYEPRYLIPLLGMVLGNGLTGIGLGLERFLSQLDEGRARVEVLLALGATRWEAVRELVGEAVRTGLIPILNSMSVVGLVTIPGMMTGQILGGTEPQLAARYQVLVMFLIASATAAGTTGVVLLAAFRLTDDQHRLRLDRVVRKAP